MSEMFIRELAQQVVKHPDFQTGISNLVVNVMQTVITRDHAGERFSLYAAKRPASQRHTRDNKIRAEWNGKNCLELSKRHNLTPRMVRKIAKGK